MPDDNETFLHADVACDQFDRFFMIKYWIFFKMTINRGSRVRLKLLVQSLKENQPSVFFSPVVS